MAYERGMTAIRWLLVSMTTLARSSVVPVSSGYYSGVRVSAGMTLATISTVMS